MTHPQHVRDAAVADYYASGDTIQQVADRHGVPRGTLGGWVRKRDDVLTGGQWVLDLVRRVQVWRPS